MYPKNLSCSHLLTIIGLSYIRHLLVRRLIIVVFQSQLLVGLDLLSKNSDFILIFVLVKRSLNDVSQHIHDQLHIICIDFL